MSSFDSFGYVKVTYTKDQMVALCRSYLENGERLGPTLRVARTICPTADAESVADMVDNIRAIMAVNGIRPVGANPELVVNLLWRHFEDVLYTRACDSTREIPTR